MNPVERILAIFAPFNCVNCDLGGRALCQECAELLPQQPSICFICGKGAVNYRTCPDCITKTKPLHVWVYGTYQDSLKPVVKSFKFGQKRALAIDMANLMADSLPFFANRPLVTFVPTLPSHSRQRGFDHAKILAKELAKQLHFPFGSTLIRQTQTRQLGASRTERKTQLRGAFRPINKNLIKNHHILLVDDVVTTGATLEVCTKELIKAGASRVDAVVFARTPKNK